MALSNRCMIETWNSRSPPCQNISAPFSTGMQATAPIRNAGRDAFSSAKLTAKIGSVPLDSRNLFPRPQWPKRPTWVRSFDPTLAAFHSRLQRTG